jgi:hypothetical protein
MTSDNYALITGASSGIGKAIAEELAKRRFNLILQSLPGEGLAEICEKLMVSYDIHALFFEIDLTAKDGPQSLFEFAINKGLKVTILVNNAGVGFDGPIESYSIDEIDLMILLNIRALTHLTYYFTPELKRHPASNILFMSSFGCYAPTAYKSVYLASKSYIFYFSRALRSEFAGSSVRTCVVVPSAVRTNKNVIDRIRRNGFFAKVSSISPAEVASVAVKAMLRGRRVILPGTLANLSLNFGFLIPEGIVFWMTRRIFGNSKKIS